MEIESSGEIFAKMPRDRFDHSVHSLESGARALDHAIDFRTGRTCRDYRGSSLTGGTLKFDARRFDALTDDLAADVGRTVFAAGFVGCFSGLVAGCAIGAAIDLLGRGGHDATGTAIAGIIGGLVGLISGIGRGSRRARQLRISVHTLAVLAQIEQNTRGI